MEKIMSKTGRQLEDSELELVSGGTVAEEGGCRCGVQYAGWRPNNPHKRAGCCS